MPVFTPEFRRLDNRNLQGAAVIGEETVPTLHDVEAFVTCARTNKQAIGVWVANSLNKIASLQGEVIPLFEPEMIENLLFGPLWQRYEVQYPQDISAEDILDILRQNGVLILSDIRAYLRQIAGRKQTSSEKLDVLLKGAGKEESRVEIGPVERVKMIDVLLLDQELEQEGKIVAMYWSVCLFHEAMLSWLGHSSEPSVAHEALSAEQESRLALVFITICRRLQHASKNDTAWIRDLRQRFEQLNSPNTLR